MYEDGSHYCWVCKDTKPSDDYIAENSDKPQSKVKRWNEKGNTVEVKPSSKPAMTTEEYQKIKDMTTTSPGEWRGIRNETNAKFGVRYSLDEDNEIISQYCPVTQDGQLVGVKVRDMPKTFYSEGRTGQDCELFMQFKFNRGGRYVVITEGECMLPSTMVLTKNGWITLSEYTIEHGEVMQGDGTFSLPLAKVSKDYNGEMVSYNSGSYSLDMTPDHNMIRLNKKSEFVKVKASDLTQKHKPVPRTVVFDSDGDNLMTRLQVMFSADFTFRKEGDIYGCLKKERKIERAIQLLEAAGVRYTVNKDSRGYSSFFIHRGHGLDVSKEFKYSRDFPNAKTVINEVVHWDGNRVTNRNQIEYSTVIRGNAEFIQTCSHVCGFTSSIIERTNGADNWLKVSILFGKQTSSTQKGCVKYNYSGKVMCLTMPSGSLLVKQGNSISVTGNCDALSAYQMINDYNKSKGWDYETAVVSPTVGANSQRQIAGQYKFFDSFENIILCFDNDKAGQSALEEVVKVLPKGKVKIMSMRHKDANEYLTKGKAQQFLNDFYDAKPYTPVGVLGSGQLYDKIVEQASITKVPFPPFMRKLNDMMIGGIPLGHIINIAAGTGLGKTTYITEIVYHWIFHSEHKIGIVSMELDAGQYGETLLSRHLSRKLALIKDKETKQRVLVSDDTRAKAKELFYSDDDQHRFYLLDNRDGSIEEIQNTIEELVVSCGCKIIVLDPLQDVLDGLSNEDQALFMKWCKGLIKSHGVTIILINHVRKSASGAANSSEGNSFTEEEIQGSSTIIKSASFNILLSRNKYSEDPIERNTTKVLLSKNRIYGLTGPAGEVYYENETNTLHDKEEYFA